MTNTRNARTLRLSAVVAALAGALLSAPATAQERKTIVFEVLLPPDAVLVIGEYKTTSTGESRTFETPPVVAGKTYSYTLRATHGGKEVVKEVVLKTDGQTVVDLRPDFAAAKPTPKPDPKPDPKPAPAIKLPKGPAKPGYVSYMEDGRLWVFKEGSKDLADFEKAGELAKHVTRVGAGPKGMTVKGPDNETVIGYCILQDGFEALQDKDGRIWVFKKGSKDYDAFKKDGEIAKHVVRINGGPFGISIKSADYETIDEYMKAYSSK